MGVSFFTYCVACDVAAPEIGDGGMLGWPSLADGWHDGAEPYENEDGDVVVPGPAPCFGRLYEALRRIELVPVAVEDFAAFLRDHDGHDVRLFSDMDDDAPCGGADFAPDADRATSNGPWTVTCRETGETFESPIDDFVAFTPRALSCADVDAFTSRVREVLKGDDYHHPPYSIDPTDVLAPLLSFFDRHRGKPLEVEVPEEVDMWFGPKRA